ncbi:MAG: CDP-diacylglycerol--serine O-phosphatidyltransferase [Legionellaceae bacterium]|nr:CDP-diacylglycerol--serine O-phosphatidyltransferase [Legionellaceae bacterium]
MKRKYSHNGIYLLPNLFTTASLFSAFYSIIASLKGQYDIAVMAIFVGMVMDAFDGRIARMTNTQTDFGAEYDSLSDMVTFGVAPSVLLYSWALGSLGKFGWLAAFIYTAAVALRLARFNTQLETADKCYFQGLACPAAAAVVASFVWVCNTGSGAGLFAGWIAIGFLLSVAALMVSNVRYYSFKELDLKGKIPFLHVLVIVLVFAAIAISPAIMLFVTSLGYALSGPLHTLLGLKKARVKRRSLAPGKRARASKSQESK